MPDRTQEIKNLRAVATACKGYIDNKIDDLQWQLGTYDLGVDTDSNVARIKSLPNNTIKSMVDYIGGKSVKYNQLVQNSNFESASGWSSVNATLTISNNVATFTATAQYGQFYTSVSSLVSGHKYFVSIEAQLTTATNKILIGINNTSKGNLVSSTSKTTTSLIIENSVNGGGNLQLIDTRSSDWDAVQVFKVILIDLTLNYGAGNEPSDVATAIPLLKANGYKLDGTDEYSTGSLKHAITTSVVYSGNLISFNDTTSATVNNVSWKIENNKFILNGTANANGSINATAICSLTKGTYYFKSFNTTANNFLTKGLNTYNNNNSFVLDNDITNMTYYISFASGTVFNNTEFTPMLIKGSTAPSTFIPYVAPITKAIPSQVLADNRYGLGFDDTNYNHLDSDGHLRGSWGIVDLSTLTWNRGQGNVYSDSLASVIKAQAYNVMPNLKAEKYSTTTTNNSYVGAISLAYVGAYVDGRIFVYVENSETAPLPTGYLVYELATSFDQDYSQYFDTDWNKVDLDKQYATCEMVVAEPIDMPNSISNLFEEVKA